MAIKVQGQQGRTYSINLDSKGQFTCTCPSFKFSDAPVRVRACKHLRMMSEVLNLQVRGSLVAH